MAWVRTSTALISFGITIYKFFQYMREQNPNAPERLLDSRIVAIVMIALGVGALIIATIQHRAACQALHAGQPGPLPRSLATYVAGLLATLGAIGLVLIVFRQ